MDKLRIVGRGIVFVLYTARTCRLATEIYKLRFYDVYKIYSSANGAHTPANYAYAFEDQNLRPSYFGGFAVIVAIAPLRLPDYRVRYSMAPSLCSTMRYNIICYLDSFRTGDPAVHIDSTHEQLEGGSKIFITYLCMVH